MRNQLGVTLLAIIAVGAIGCDQLKMNKTPKTDEEKVGYALGQQIGKNFKQQNVDADPKMLAAGVEDVTKGTPSKMTDQEMQEAINKLQEKARAKMQAEGEKNKANAMAFLEKHKTEEGVSTTPSGLQYKVIKPGSGKGKGPMAKDIVKVHYTGTLTTGEKFDSSIDRGQPAELPVGNVIPGWAEAIKMMKTGDRWKIVIPPELAYGAEGRPGIPPYSVLIFDVELLEIKASK
jgi:FKBP-type peptidyl-prolyl cis-trans isomerase